MEQTVEVGERAPPVRSLRREARVMLLIGLVPWIVCIAADTSDVGFIALVGVHSVGVMLCVFGFAVGSLALAMFGGMSAFAGGLTIAIGLGGTMQWAIDPEVLRTGSVAFLLTAGGLLWYRAWAHWPGADAEAVLARVARVVRRGMLALGMSMVAYALGMMGFILIYLVGRGEEEGVLLGAAYTGAHAPGLAIALTVLGRIGRIRTRVARVAIAVLLAHVPIWYLAVDASDETTTIGLLGGGAILAAIAGAIAVRGYARTGHPISRPVEKDDRRPSRRARSLMRVSAAAHLVFLVAVALVQTAEWFGAVDEQSTLAIAVGLALLTGAVGIPVSIAQLSYGLRSRFTVAWFHACLSLAAPVVHAADYAAASDIITGGATVAHLSNLALGTAFILAVIWTGFRWHAVAAAEVAEAPAGTPESDVGPRPRFRSAVTLAAVLAAAGALAIALIIGVLQ
jgi:hypothetical protein